MTRRGAAAARTPAAAAGCALRPLDTAPAALAALQRVLEGAPEFFATTTGRPPGPDEARSVLTDLPPGRSAADKVVYGLYEGERLVGCADVVRGWNAPDKAIVGLLLLVEERQRRGLGRTFAALVERAIAAWPEIATVRIGVVETRAGALAFWRRLGYRETGERKRDPALVADVVVLEKPLAR